MKRIGDFILVHGGPAAAKPHQNPIIVLQKQIDDNNCQPDLLIHIGNMSDFPSIVSKPKEVWRVAEDGQIVDRYKKLTNVFEMREQSFFNYYADHAEANSNSSYKETS